MMVGVGGTSKTGKVHHYYKCGNLIYKKSCDKKTVKKAWIELLVVILTRDFVLRDEVIDRLADSTVDLQNRENTTIPLLQKQLGDVDKRIGNLINSIEEGVANASVKQRLDELEAKKADLEIALAREKIEKTTLTKEQIVFWISRFKEGDIDDPAYRKNIVDIFVNSIFLYDDKLVIAFNWKDGTKTVTLAELESAIKSDSEKIEAVNSLCLSDFRCSHLDCCTPPVRVVIRAMALLLFDYSDTIENRLCLHSLFSIFFAKRFVQLLTHFNVRQIDFPDEVEKHFHLLLRLLANGGGFSMVDDYMVDKLTQNCWR